MCSETGGTADGARSRADSRVKEIADLSKRVDSAAKVLTHVVHGKPESTLIGVAEKHVSRTQSGCRFREKLRRFPCRMSISSF